MDLFLSHLLQSFIWVSINWSKRNVMNWKQIVTNQSQNMLLSDFGPFSLIRQKKHTNDDFYGACNLCWIWNDCYKMSIKVYRTYIHRMRLDVINFPICNFISTFIKGDKIFFQNLLSSTGNFTPLWRSSATKG